MTEGRNEPSGTTLRLLRRLRWPLRVAALLAVLELVARQYIARPNRILRPSSDPEMVYENAPGTWLGHAKFDIWRAPIYMVLDLVNTHGAAANGPPPSGYTVYRIDEGGCRIPPVGTPPSRADVVVVGSSQSFGLFVPEEETVRAMLEPLLRDRLGPALDVANCGVIGHHILPSLRTAELVEERKHPSVIAFLVRPWHLRTQVDYTEVLDPRNPILRWMVRHSSFARAAYYWSQRRNDEVDEPYERAANIAARLDRFAAVAEKAKTRAIFYLLDDKSEEAARLDDFGKQLAARGFTVVRVDTPNSSRDDFVDKERHWSGKGARHMAEVMVDSVVAELARANASRSEPGSR